MLEIGGNIANTQAAFRSGDIGKRQCARKSVSEHLAPATTFCLQSHDVHTGHHIHSENQVGINIGTIRLERLRLPVTGCSLIQLALRL